MAEVIWKPSPGPDDPIFKEGGRLGCRVSDAGPSWLFACALEAGVRKPPRKEPAGGPEGGCLLWGFDRARVSVGDVLAGASGGRLPMMKRILSRRAMVVVRIAPNRWRCGGDWRRWGSGGAAPGASSSSGCMMRLGNGRGHSAAALIPAWGEGGARGSPPRPKLSTMIMRPPQQGHGGR